MGKLDAWVKSAEARMAAVEQKMAASRRVSRRLNTAFNGGRTRQRPTSPPALGPIAPHLPPL